MFAFLRRLFSRKSKQPTGPEPPIVAVDLYARTSGTEPWSLVGRFDSPAAADQATAQHAANECFKTGRMVYFEFKYTPVYAEPAP